MNSMRRAFYHQSSTLLYLYLPLRSNRNLLYFFHFHSYAFKFQSFNSLTKDKFQFTFHRYIYASHLRNDTIFIVMNLCDIKTSFLVVFKIFRLINEMRNFYSYIVHNKKKIPPFNCTQFTSKDTIK